MTATRRSADPSKFFTDQEREQILEAIRKAEEQTSGEIRVHVEKKCKGDVLKRALQVFQKLGMTKTALRNGTLIYLATGDRKFAVLGDEGINKVVPDNFWQDVVNGMSEYFKKDAFAEGLCWGIERIGEKLKTFFPHQKDDVNELPDEISEGDLK